MNKGLLECASLKIASANANMNTAAITGARIGLQKFERLAVILVLGTSTAAVVQALLKQHNAASGGTTKALSIKNPYYYKAAAATAFTKVDPAAAADTYDLSSVFEDDGGILVFDIAAEDLDSDNGYFWASINTADSTADKDSLILYAVHDGSFNPCYDIDL